MLFGRLNGAIFHQRAIFNRHFLGFAGILFFIFFLNNSVSGNEPKPLDKVTLQLKWQHQFQFAGYYAAQEKGYYKDAGLDVTIVEARPGIDPAEAVLSGKADFGIAGSTLLQLRDQGKPVVVLAAIFQHSPLAIMMKDRKTLRDISLLNGKKVMVEPLSAEIMTYLAVENVNQDSMIIVPHSFSVNDLIDNKVDAMTVYTTTEPYELRKLKIPYTLFHPIDCGIDFYGDCLFTTEKEIKLHPGLVKAFREASLRGWKYAMEHPDELISIIKHKYGSKRSREQLQFEAIETRSLINPNIIELGYMNKDRWQQIADAYKKYGQISRNIPLNKFIYDAEPAAFNKKPFLITLVLLTLLTIAISITAMRFKKLNLKLQKEIELHNHTEFELKENYAMQKMLVNIALKYINIPLNEFNSAIQVSLRELGEFFNADSAYIFKYDFEKQICINVHEWCAEGIPPQIDNLQALPLTMISGWVERHRRGETVYVPDIQKIEYNDLQDLIERQGIESLLTIPMMNGEQCIGFVGLDSTLPNHAYSDDEQYLLKIFAEILANVEMREQNAKRLQAEQANLNAIFKAAPVGMLLLDENAVIVNHNDAIARLVSRKCCEIIDNTVGNGLGCAHSCDDPRGCGFSPACQECPLRQAVLHVLQTGESIYNQEMEYAVLINEKQYCLWISVNAEPVSLNRHKHVVVAIDEITKRKHASDLLREKMDELQRFHALSIGRELTMIELKKEINSLLLQNGQKEKYKIIDD